VGGDRGAKNPEAGTDGGMDSGSTTDMWPAGSAPPAGGGVFQNAPAPVRPGAPVALKVDDIDGAYERAGCCCDAGENVAPAALAAAGDPPDAADAAAAAAAAAVAAAAMATGDMDEDADAIASGCSDASGSSGGGG